MANHFAGLKAIVVYFVIWLLRKCVRPFSGRTETWWAKEQYDALNTILTYFNVEDIGFNTAMNMGFQHDDYSTKKYDELFEGVHPITRLQLQMYHRVTTGGSLNIDVSGKEMLEVGCGRGGGTNFVASKLKPKSMVGIDLSSDGIDHCNQTFQGDALSFKVGNAQEMPLEKDSFDIVINVESSHCYPNVGKFLMETRRVLRKGGHFLYCDISTPDAVAQLRENLNNKLGLKIVEEEDLTPGMIKALDEAAVFRTKALQKLPFFLRASIMNVIGQPGGITYTNFTNGTWCYVRFACEKIG